MSGISTRLDFVTTETVVDGNEITVKLEQQPSIVNFIGFPGPAGKDGAGVGGSSLYVSAKDEQFGAVGDGVTDDTVALQSLINYLSNSYDVVGFIPPGLYKYSKLYLFYDALLNPGFNQTTSKRGRLTILGAGSLDVARAQAYDLTNGTILESTYTGSDPCFQVASAALGHNASPYSSRNVTVKDLTLASNNTGYILEAAGSPEFWAHNCTFTQKNASGSGLNIRSSWFGKIERSRIVFGGTADTSTGVGLTLGTEEFAGQFEVSGTSLIQDFGVNFDWVGPDKFSNLNFNQCSIQSANIVGIRVSSILYSISLSKIHFENNIQDVLINAETDILMIDGVRILAGKTGSGNAKPRISVTAGIKTGEVKNVDCFRPWSNLLEVAGSVSSRCNLDVSHIAFIHDSVASLTKSIVGCSDSSGLIKVQINNHGYETGRKVKIEAVSGTAEANGEWYVTVVDANNFTLDGSVFSNAYVSGGQSTLLCYVIKPLNSTVVPAVSDITFTGGSKDLDNTGALRVIDTQLNSSFFYRSVNGLMTPYLSAPITEYQATGADIQVRTEFKHFRFATTSLTNVKVIIPDTDGSGRFSGTFCFITNKLTSTDRLRIRQNHDSVIVGFVAPGETALIFHEKINHTVQVQKLLQANKSITYGDSDPAWTGQTGDLHIMANPAAGGYAGRIMTTTGWKQFGAIVA